jgi:hypothetical protein
MYAAEFPEFLDVIFSNPLNPFIKLAVQMLGGPFFGGDEDS